MNLATAIRLYADANINQSDKGSSIISIPDKLQTPQLRDLARRRLVKTNPDIDAESDPSQKLISQEQSDDSAFTGKKYRVQDTSYGHLISEHDNESSAEKAAEGRPYSRVIHAPEWQHTQLSRDLALRKVLRKR